MRANWLLFLCSSRCRGVGGVYYCPSRDEFAAFCVCNQLMWRKTLQRAGFCAIAESLVRRPRTSLTCPEHCFGGSSEHFRDLVPLSCWRIDLANTSLDYSPFSRSLHVEFLQQLQDTRTPARSRQTHRCLRRRGPAQRKSKPAKTAT